MKIIVLVCIGINVEIYYRFPVKKLQLNDCMAVEDAGVGYSMAVRRMKAYFFTTKNRKNIVVCSFEI